MLPELNISGKLKVSLRISAHCHDNFYKHQVMDEDNKIQSLCDLALLMIDSLNQPRLNAIRKIYAIIFRNQKTCILRVSTKGITPRGCGFPYLKK